MIYALILYVCGFIIMYAVAKTASRVFMSDHNTWTYVIVAMAWPLMAILVLITYFNSDFVE